MNTYRKFWFTLVGMILAMAVIACSCNTLIPTPAPSPYPTSKPLPTLAPSPTMQPLPTLAPSPTSESVPLNTLEPTEYSMAGEWLDPDTTGTITTIVAKGSGYAVESVINPNRGGNELTKTNWSNGTLTWTYCVPNGNCITSVTGRVSADSLYTTWSDDRGASGETTFERDNAPTTNNTNTSASMAGKWLDPDTSGTVTTIVAQGGGYAVESVINPDRGGNELTTQSWANDTLTWTYCIPNGNCITSVTGWVNATELYTTWSDDRGYTGETTFERVP
jgi:hypothetical protein